MRGRNRAGHSAGPAATGRACLPAAAPAASPPLVGRRRLTAPPRRAGRGTPRAALLDLHRHLPAAPPLLGPVLPLRPPPLLRRLLHGAAAGRHRRKWAPLPALPRSTSAGASRFSARRMRLREKREAASP